MSRQQLGNPAHTPSRPWYDRRSSPRAGDDTSRRESRWAASESNAEATACFFSSLEPRLAARAPNCCRGRGGLVWFGDVGGSVKAIWTSQPDNCIGVCWVHTLDAKPHEPGAAPRKSMPLATQPTRSLGANIKRGTGYLRESRYSNRRGSLRMHLAASTARQSWRSLQARSDVHRPGRPAPPIPADI